MVEVTHAPYGDVPQLDPSFMIDRLHLSAIEHVIDRADRTGVPQNIALTGPIACGKTTMARQIGALRRAPTFLLGRSGYEGGYAVRVGGTLVHQPLPLVAAIETEGAVVVLDDLEFEAESVRHLLPILDPTTRTVHVAAIGRTIRVAPGVIIVGTWNPKYNVRVTPVWDMFVDGFGVKLQLPELE